MSEQTTSSTPAPAGSSGCCGPTTAAAQPAPTGGVCCGTAQAAAEAGACCDPATKADALAAGASCCGPTAASTTASVPVAAAETAAVDRPAGPAEPPVVVIGAGPVGLAAAAHLAERGLPFLVLEAGDTVGASVRQWGQVRLFSPWRYNIDAAARRLLDAAGWAAPDPDVLPTGAELVEDYLQPLAKLPAIAAHLRLDARVVAISRDGIDRVRTAGREHTPFVVRLADGRDLPARAVIDASGTWATPNVLGVNGLPAHGEPQAAAWIDRALPDVLGADRDRYAGRHTVVVGSGHSAATTLLALAELAQQLPGTRITWAVRAGNPDRAYGGGADDSLPARGALGTGLRMLVEAGRITLAPRFAVHTIRTLGGGVKLVARNRDDAERVITADRVVAATGYRPDHSIAAELRLDLEPILGSTRTLAPLIDPNLHSCGTVRPHGVDELSHPEPNYWAVGVKSYGRAPTFLLSTGYEQVRSITAALAGDWTAARDVQLNLPETGVCSATLGARDLVADAASRFGLSPDIPAKLVAAATAHLPAAGSAAEAARLAALELDIDEGVAVQLAALAAGQFDQPTRTPQKVPAIDRHTELVTVSARSGGCCG
jgi:thioredoxin reductase